MRSAASSPKTYYCERRSIIYNIHRTLGGAYNIYARNARGMMVSDEGLSESLLLLLLSLFTVHIDAPSLFLINAAPVNTAITVYTQYTRV